MFAVKKEYQNKGIGRKLLEMCLKYNQEVGFLHLKGDFNFSIQTNAAPWNNHVVRLFVSVGFRKRATKFYSNREKDQEDFVFGYSPEDK